MENHPSTDITLRKTNEGGSDYPVLHRAFSTIPENQTLVNNQRKILAKNYRRIAINEEIVTIDHNDADALFILPNLYELPENLRIRVMNNLIDTSRMVSLEETKRLNWWVDQQFSCPKLYPLMTRGDGNCLLHATSLAMWGFHDHALSMRKALNETLITSKPNNSLYRRWRWTQSVQNKKYHLIFSEPEWNKEWKRLLRLSSIEPRISQKKLPKSTPPTDEKNHSKTGGSIKSSSLLIRQYYESLEEFHVYVLANNIRRPIIIYSDTILRADDGEAISPIEFGGIYLPLEIPPDKCHKQPIFLAFDAAHFTALVPMESITKVSYRIPLIDLETLELLPIHFYNDPGLSFSWPIDEELSDETIHLYTNYEQSRLETLEKYLNLSKESPSLNNLIPSSTTASPTDQTSITENSNSTNLDSSNEGNSTKKSSRVSSNPVSKIIRRTFLDPLSSTKRTLLKHQHHQSSVINENSSQQRKSSPLLNHRTNILTIILTNFQPKRPKTSDNMIQNYIETCINEYHPKQIHQDNENSQTNSQSSVYYRHHPSSTYRQESLPVNKLQNNDDIDDNEDLVLSENEQFSTNINDIQPKTNQLIQTNPQHFYIKSHVNAISDKSSHI